MPIKAIYDNLKPISIILIVSGAGILFYYLIRGIVGLDPLFPVGENMVDNEIIIIPDLIYIKPITLSLIMIYLGTVCGLEHLSKGWGLKLSDAGYSIIKIFLLLIIFISLYEIFFNFMLWCSLISSIATSGDISGNIDLLVNKFPNSEQPWNLVFASKLFYFYFLTSLTGVYYIERWRRLREYSQEAQYH
ncbi:hypothetical protein DRN87_02840 [Candidatus Geothermarchaeota archaeon]|nr:MAG: hypothetical protein DRN87_02840 [Candidatus Geothermarchaeota archaeon]